RLGLRVRRRPAVVAVAALAGVGVLALGLVGARVGLSQTDQLLGDPESVAAQEVVDASFSAGLTAQTVVLAPDAVAADAVATALSVPGVAGARAGESAEG
ncbi:MMPL family transporter, partial [Clavibacter phaseoli]